MSQIIKVTITVHDTVLDLGARPQPPFQKELCWFGNQYCGTQFKNLKDYSAWQQTPVPAAPNPAPQAAPEPSTPFPNKKQNACLGLKLGGWWLTGFGGGVAATGAGLVPGGTIAGVGLGMQFVQDVACD